MITDIDQLREKFFLQCTEPFWPDSSVRRMSKNLPPKDIFAFFESELTARDERIKELSKGNEQQ